MVLEKIGFPKWIVDDKLMASYYAKLQLYPLHFSNIISKAKYENKRAFDKFEQTVDKNRWCVSPSTGRKHRHQHARRT